MKTAKRLFLFVLVVVSSALFYSCKKNSPEPRDQQPLSSVRNVEKVTNTVTSTCRDELQPDWVADTIDVATQLGPALVGSPYSVSIMQQAAINIYGTTQGITANRKYIRYKPSTLGQLDSLVNTDIELFDYPLDREVVEEGDYYPQPGIGESEIPWFYSVVNIDYQQLSGIQYEELAQVYIPDDDLYLENEAFRITGNPVENFDCGDPAALSNSTTSQSKQIVPNVPQCPDGFHWDYSLHECIENNCPFGYHWDGSQCVPDAPPPPPAPPASKQPTGQILVRDFKNIVGGFQDVAVRRTEVVLRRFLKVERVYTNDQGNFLSAKHFHNRVNILVKFKNSSITTRGLKGIRLWQTLLPIEQGIGKYSGDLRNVNWVFTSPQMGNSKANRNWWAAQLMNAHIEFNENAAILGVGSIPNNMHVLVTAWRAGAGAGSTPMNRHRNSFQFSDALLQQFLVQPNGAYWGQVYNNVYNNNGVLRRMDMTFGYNTDFAIESDIVKEIMYHEFAHSAHFNKVGENWWNDLVYSESYETSRFGVNDNRSPYGIGDDGFLSDYMSLAESWAEHVGRSIADRVYGLNSTAFGEQGEFYDNNFYITGSSHVNYLEDFSPFRTNDPFHWIPDGLYYDLMDDRNDQFVPNPRVLINDAVFGYINQQFFNALESDVRSLPAFRQRLLQQNGNNQLNEVTQLFNAYGY